MISIEKFSFSPFQQNTTVVYDDSGDCVIIDPGCSNDSEENELKSFINNKNLNPTHLWLTHAHLDHIWGNDFVQRTYGLKPEMHKADLPTLKMAPMAAQMYGIPGFKPSPEPSLFIETGTVSFGNTKAEVRFTPGHAPGHIVFIFHDIKTVINGDVLFQGSIGRTDLPGGDYDTLIDSIRTQMFTLPDDYVVYTGHGPETSIGHEKQYNPFLNG